MPTLSSLTRALGAILGAATVACASHSDSVCEDIGNCSQGGSSAWIRTCKSEAKALAAEASASCGARFDDYYSCAASNFQCVGATSEFPGCDAKLAALDLCIDSIRAATSCEMLETREAACSGADAGPALGIGTTPDMDAGDDGGDGGNGVTGNDAGGNSGPNTPALACTTLRDCQAQCYLSNVTNVCAPQVSELPNFTLCAQSCPVMTRADQ